MYLDYFIASFKVRIIRMLWNTSSWDHSHALEGDYLAAETFSPPAAAAGDPGAFVVVDGATVEPYIDGKVWVNEWAKTQETGG